MILFNYTKHYDNSLSFSLSNFKNNFNKLVKFLSNFVIKIMIEIVEIICEDEKFQIMLFNNK